MMKKAIFIFMAMVSIAITAQNEVKDNKDAKKEFRKNLDPDQKAELMSKRMTLDLNLTDSQQKQVKQLFIDSEAKKPDRIQDRKEMTSSEKLEMRIDRLDNHIAMKRKMKEILTAEQFEKWENQSRAKKMNHKKGFKPFKQKQEKTN